MVEKTLAVIGLGYVGLPLALLAERKGYRVIGVDKNEEKVNSIRRRVAPFSDERVAEQLKTSSLEVTCYMNDIAKVSNVVICVPTPVHEDHTPDLGPLETACLNISEFLKKDQLVVLESTVNPGVSENIAIPDLQRSSHLKVGRDFYFAHCPERIDPGNKKWTIENIPRVVGGCDKNSLERAVQFYQSIIDTAIKPMGSLKEAEAVKIVENAFRDVNIAFVNELAMSFSILGVDLMNVLEGAATKPFAFMPHYPGVGVGGHCIPVDPYYLIEEAKRKGFNHDFLSLARRINSEMPKFTADLVMKGLNERKIPLNGSHVTVLGLAYKPDIDDCRESPSFDLIKYLIKYGAEVVVFDPYVPKKSTAKSLNEAVQGSQAVVIATAHKIFRELTPGYLLRNKVNVVVDGRNCLSKERFVEAGITYKGIGR